MRKTKFLITILLGVCMLLCMPVFSDAANEELVIVEKTENEYIIYLKQYLNQEFEFAFSNNNVADESTLNFIDSALDKEGEEANNIAYVDSNSVTMFENTTYMWVKVNGEIKISAREINIQDNITKAELESVGKTSTIVPIELGQEQTVNEVNEEGTKITETVGVVKVLKEITNGEYQLIERKTTTETDNLFALAELIEKNEFTDAYTEIKASKEFIELYNKLYGELNSENWKTVKNSSVQQPVDAETGDQYILWIKGENIQDVHFLTSYREYDEEIVKEEVKTKLPYTYDNNTILIVLAIVIVAIVLVSIRIAVLKKKEMMNK